MTKDIEDVNESLDANAKVTTDLISLTNSIKQQLDQVIAAGNGITHEEAVAMKARIDAESQLIADAITANSGTTGGGTDPVGEAQPVLNSDGSQVFDSTGAALMQVWDSATSAWVTPTLDPQGIPVDIH